VVKESLESLDNKPSIVLANPDLEAVKRARRWLRGAALILHDAANGHETVERIASEAALLADLAAIAIFDLES
jgi:CheY-like chemotaxis protein